MNDLFIALAIEKVRENYAALFKQAIISEIRIGPYLCAVKTESGFCGVSGVDWTVNQKLFEREKLFGEFSPGCFSGRKISDLLDYSNKNPHLHVLKIAALNALTAEIISDDTCKKTYKIIRAKDPVELLDLNIPQRICIVGAFQSYIRKFAGTHHPLHVLEFNENTFSEEHLKYFVQAERASEVIPESEIIIITGSTLANRTLPELLSFANPQSTIVLVGPTAGFLPELFFYYGINIIGSVYVKDTEMVLKAISDGAFAYHLFSMGAEKICIVNE